MSNKVEDIISTLKWKVNCGIYDHNHKLPSENAIAIKYDCSRLTARKALQSLKDEGLIISKKSKGYFVSPEYKKLQYTTKNSLLPVLNEVYKRRSISDPYINDIFKGLGYDFKKCINRAFAFIKIQKDANDRPFTILHSFLNPDLFNEVQLYQVRDSLSAFFSKHGVKVKKRIEKVLIIKAPKFVQEKLYIKEDEQVVAAYSIMLTKDSTIIELAVRYTLLSEYSDTFERNY